MKKGLLSLLAVALTVVSCQNYDDQFESLTEQITQLSTTVAGLTAITDQVTALQQTVNGLSTASSLAALAGQVSDNATAIAAAGSSADAATAAVGMVADQVASVQASITAILADLENVATAADLDTISATLAIVQADVKEILAGNATISQPILINSSASLQYVESLISTRTDDPNVIVNNTVTINTGTLTAAEKARANEVAAKIATVIGDVTITGAETITMSELTYIDGNYIVSGADHSEPKLASITGDLIITQEVAAPLSFGVLSTVTNIVAKGTTLATVTSIDLSGVTVSGKVGTGTGGTSTSTLDAKQATGIVDLGTVDNFDTIKADKASQIIIDDAAAYPSPLTINAAVASSIDLTAATSIGGALTIVATDTTVLNADSLTGTLTAVNTAGNLGTANLDGVLEIIGSIGASTLNADALTHLGFSGTVDLDGLTSIDMPNVLIGTQAVGSAKAVSVSVASIDDLDFTPLTDLAVGVVRSLTLSAQTAQVSLTSTAQALNLKTLSITLAGNDLGVDVQVSGTNSITALTIGGIARDVDVVSNTGLVTLTTNGYVNDFQASTLAALASLDINHTYSTDFTRPFNFEANSLANITSLDLSSLNKVFTLTITNNSALEDITAPLNTIPITFDALNGTTPDITVTGNSIQATYTAATPTIPSDGISAQTDFVSSTIESASLSSIKAFILANIAVDPSTTYDLDWDVHYGAVNPSFAAAITADCVEHAGPDGLYDTLLGSCTTLSGDPTDDSDNGISDAGEIDTAYELAKIQ